MMNTWALPSFCQASEEVVNSGSPIPTCISFCLRVCPPRVRVSDGQPLAIQSGLPGEAF